MVGIVGRGNASRSLGRRPSEAVVADEPTSGLDSAAAMRILDLISTLRHDREPTVVMVTRDLAVAGPADRRIDMLDRRPVKPRSAPTGRFHGVRESSDA